MEATKKIIEITPAIPAVTEEVVVLELSIHEARVLRALYEKAVGRAGEVLVFLSRLNGLFPGDRTTGYSGIGRVEIKEH